jgi:N-acetylneuraminic acid mutarotase
MQTSYTTIYIGNLNDVYRFSPAANNWTALSPSGSGPSPRYMMGFAATPDGMLYVFGGWNSSGGSGNACSQLCSARYPPPPPSRSDEG